VRLKTGKPLIYKNEFEALKQDSNDYLLAVGILCQLDDPVKTFFFTNWSLQLSWVLPKWFSTNTWARVVPVTSVGKIVSFNSKGAL
jgi:hypothetical protein